MMSNEILELRKKLSLIQEQMVSLLMVSQPTLARWEQGKIEPTGDAANRLKQLQVIMNDLQE